MRLSMLGPPAIRNIAIGFLHHDNENHGRDQSASVCESCVAWQAAEVWELNAALRDAYFELLKEIRRYAIRLEHMDPDSHNAAHTMADVVLTVSDAESAQERLDNLRTEAQRLMRAVTDGKRAIANKPEAWSKRAASWARGLVHALFLGLCALATFLLAQGALL
jgi:hypothetical protein